MQSRSILFRSIILITIISLAITACLPRTVLYGGIVKGVVYADLNGNGTIEAGEGPLDGVVVSLSDCGPIVTQTTGADGSFNFSNLPEGTCHVSVAKTGWIFSGSYPSLGYPVPVASDPDLPTAFSLFLMPVSGAFVPTVAASDTPIPAGPTETATDTPIPPTEVSSEPRLTPSGKNVNCRFGPDMTFLAVGFVYAGDVVPILGTNAAHSWWQIQNPQDIKGHYCWVSGAAVNTMGDISLVPIVKIPIGLVTGVSVSVNPGSVVHGTCGGPNAVSFQVSITTNGPATVIYRVSIYNGDGSFRNSPGDQTLTFPSASTQSFDPGGAYSTDCGSFYIVASTSSPNSLSARADWSVVSP